MTLEEAVELARRAILPGCKLLDRNRRVRGGWYFVYEELRGRKHDLASALFGAGGLLVDEVTGDVLELKHSRESNCEKSFGSSLARFDFRSTVRRLRSSMS